MDWDAVIDSICHTVQYEYYCTCTLNMNMYMQLYIGTSIMGEEVCIQYSYA